MIIIFVKKKLFILCDEYWTVNDTVTYVLVGAFGAAGGGSFNKAGGGLMLPHPAMMQAAQQHHTHLHPLPFLASAAAANDLMLPAAATAAAFLPKLNPLSSVYVSLLI